MSHESPQPARPVERKTPDRGTIVTAVAGMLLVALVVVSSSGTFKKAMLRWKFQGAEAPEFVLKELETMAPVRLTEHRGKVVLLDFWATWCPPCREQMPVIEKLSRDKALADKVQIFSINTDEPAPDRLQVVRAFIKQRGYTMKTLVDTGVAANSYQIFSIPTLVIITPAGQIQSLRQGVHSEQELRELIARAGE